MTVSDESHDPVNNQPRRDGLRDVGLVQENLAALYALRVVRQVPAVNLYDANDRFILTAELPGLTAADFEVSMTGEAVTLRGLRARDATVRDEAYRRQERPFGPWSRTITLPSGINADAVTASLAQGILTVVVPKIEEHRPRPINVTMIGS